MNEGYSDRMVLAMFNEGCRALDESVVSDANTLVLATVFGMGFSPFHGGLLRNGEARGLTEIRDSLTALTKAPDVADRPGGKLRSKEVPSRDNFDRLSRNPNPSRPVSAQGGTEPERNPPLEDGGLLG